MIERDFKILIPNKEGTLLSKEGTLLSFKNVTLKKHRWISFLVQSVPVNYYVFNRIEIEDDERWQREYIYNLFTKWFH